MPMNLAQLRLCICHLGHWAQEQVVGEVPGDLGLCEFDCRHTSCPAGEWATCQRRISKAAGELMPYVEQHTCTVQNVETDQDQVCAR